MKLESLRPGGSGRREVKVAYGDQLYSGAYEIRHGMVHVASAYGSAEAAMGLRPFATAERLLMDIAIAFQTQGGVGDRTA